MNNNKTPASTVIFYIIGIILLIVSAFMLVTAITYTKTYLQSYDASFSDMWSNSIQYIITQFVPYFGMGIICLGLGRAIKGSAAAKAAAPIAETKAADAQPKEAVAPQAAQSEVDESKVEDLSRGRRSGRRTADLQNGEKSDDAAVSCSGTRSRSSRSCCRSWRCTTDLQGSQKLDDAAVSGNRIHSRSC